MPMLQALGSLLHNHISGKMLVSQLYNRDLVNTILKLISDFFFQLYIYIYIYIYILILPTYLYTIKLIG